MKKTARILGTSCIAIMIATGVHAWKGALPQHSVGQMHEGGIICMVTTGDDGVEHGLVMSTTELSSGAGWGKTNAEIGAKSNSDGKDNTDKILAAGGSKSEAAGLCRAYSGGGKNDWYLPSSDEMKTIYAAREKLNGGLTGDGNTQLGSGWHWTSTEYMRGSAYGIDMSTGEVSSSNKLRNGKVRAVRKF